ncbi:hypothetical protein SLA2020_039120 [Shorea laevis]
MCSQPPSSVAFPAFRGSSSLPSSTDLPALRTSSLSPNNPCSSPSPKKATTPNKATSAPHLPLLPSGQKQSPSSVEQSSSIFLSFIHRTEQQLENKSSEQIFFAAEQSNICFPAEQI